MLQKVMTPLGTINGVFVQLLHLCTRSSRPLSLRPGACVLTDCSRSCCVLASWCTTSCTWTRAFQRSQQ